MVNTMRKFPESKHSYQVLMEIADQFVIPDRYYDNQVQKIPFEDAPADLVDEVVATIPSPRSQVDVEEAYATATPFDVYFLYPRLPTVVLMKITDLRKLEAIQLKKICNRLRDIQYKEKDLRDTPIVETEEETAEVKSVPKSRVFSVEELQKALRPYLNEKMIMQMPSKAADLFVMAPRHMLKRMWTGRQFDKCYANALKKYRK